MDQTAQSGSAAGARVRPPVGPIVIARHGKPALNRNLGPKLDWREYVDWWDRYEAGSLEEGQSPPDELRAMVADAARILASPRPRATETARMAAPEGAMIETDTIFYEAPLPPPRFRGVKFLPKTWNVLARTWWSFGHQIENSEHIRSSRARASLAAKTLHEAARDGKVFLAAHGWFNRMLRPELKRLGWECVRDGRDAYWSFRVYEYRGKP